MTTDWPATILKMKEQLGLYDPKTGEEKYTEFTTFKRKVIEVAKKELNSTDMKFSYKFMKEGRSYQWIEFYFTPLGKKNEQETLEDVFIRLVGRSIEDVEREEKANETNEGSEEE